MVFTSNYMIWKPKSKGLLAVLSALTHSVSFSNRFILVRVTVDLEVIVGTVCMRYRCTLDGMPDHHI